MFTVRVFSGLLLQAILFTHLSISVLLPIPIENYESAASCAFEIAKRFFVNVPNLNIFSINDSRDYDLLSLLYASTIHGKILKEFATFEVDFYEVIKRYSVVVADSLTELIEHKQQIHKLMLWNARSRYLFIIRKNSDDLDDAVDVLWYNYIINAVIMMPSEFNDTSNEIYTWYPYENGQCGVDFKARLVDTCANGVFESNADLYPLKVPDVVHGCPVRAQVIIEPPFVMPPDDGNVVNDKVLNITTGIEIMMMRTIAEIANFTLLPMSSTVTNDWGLATADGNTSGTIKILYEKRAELGFGSYGPSAERRMFCDYSASHTFESLSWCVPTAQLAPRWRNLLDTFQYSTWLSMIGAYFIVSVIIWSICYCQPQDLTSYVMLKNCLKFLFSIFIAISVNETPKKQSGRIVFFVWVVFGLHFVAAYQAKLISALLHPAYERQMSTLEELLTSDIDWASLPTLKRFYNNTDDWRVARIIENWKGCDDFHGCMARIAYKRDFALCVLEQNARYELLKYTDKNSKPLIFCFPSYLTYPSEIYMTKGFPLKDRIDRLIYRIKATGLMAKWQRDMAYLLLLQNRKKILKAEVDDSQKLTIDHLQGAFFIFGFGLVASVLALASEVLYTMVKKKTLKKNVISKWRNYSRYSAKTRAQVRTIRLLQNHHLPLKQ